MLLTGVLLRVRFHFFFPQQLAAYHDHPRLMAAAYSCFLAGNILLWPAVLTAGNMIGKRRPGWATWGTAFVMFGLFARTFHAGADFLAFQVAKNLGVESATRVIAASYGAFHIVSALNATILLGWILLAIGAYLSKTMGLARSAALALMSALMMGVLKGSSFISVIAASGLCAAFVPLGITLLRTPPSPSLKKLLLGSAAGLVFVAALFIFGRLG
ncbi:MAG: hypothetical protein JST28_23885 [Acidobacteria bacterium]|nr:hypothetical protein [Acidobacteriota bacterium]